uniref:Pre-mRNA-splicing factor CWC22 homolog n=1 Tax=Cacopsylla melanoneura TaxID=428564 RepID=A0A8D8V5F1_9HEMI
MHKHHERKHHRQEHEEDIERSRKHKKKRNESEEDEGFQDRNYEEGKRHKKKRKEIDSAEERYIRKKQGYEEPIEPDRKHRRDERKEHNSKESNEIDRQRRRDDRREIISINDSSRRDRHPSNHRELERNEDENQDEKRKKKRDRKDLSDSELDDDRKKKKRSRKEKDESEEEEVEARIKKNKKDRIDRETVQSEESEDDRSQSNHKEKDASDESDEPKEKVKGRDSKRHKEKYVDSDTDDKRERRKPKVKEEPEDEPKDKERGRERKKKHKKEKRNDRSSDVEEGRYESRDKDRRRRRRKDKKRDREDEQNEDSEMEYISRDVGSRYYEVNKDYDEEEEQLPLGGRYYDTGNTRHRKENLKDVSNLSSATTKDRDTKKDKPDSTTAAAAAAPGGPKTSTNILSSKTGGAYIPPAKLKLMQQSISDKSSVEYQRISWEALKKSIHGSVNKVNTGNIGIIARKLFQENIIRGRGLLTRTILQAQAASPTFTNVYAALVDIINSKFPSLGELLLNRCIQQFKRCFKRNDKSLCINSVTFIAHLVNQQVAHEIIVLEILTLLVETPTNDSIEVACALLKECGKKLTELSSKGVTAIFSMLLNILHEGKLEKRVQYMIEVLAQVRKDNFKDFPDVVEDLDLVPEEDKFTHLITLDGVKDSQDILNVFQFDADYLTNEEKYQTLRAEILGDDDDDEDGDDEDDDEDDSEEEEEVKKKEGEGGEGGTIIDNTETNLVALRRIIYLTIHSSLDFEECAHKLLRMQLKPGQESELCHMFLDCCAEQRTYEKFFGLLAQRFCEINRIYVGPLEAIFRDSYATVHRLDINKLRNVAKFFAHQLFTDAIGWHVLSCIHLNEEETTSSGRIFIKILFQELSEYMGLSKLNAKIKVPSSNIPFLCFPSILQSTWSCSGRRVPA